MIILIFVKALGLDLCLCLRLNFDLCCGFVFSPVKFVLGFCRHFLIFVVFVFALLASVLVLTFVLTF